MQDAEGLLSLDRRQVQGVLFARRAGVMVIIKAPRIVHRNIKAAVSVRTRPGGIHPLHATVTSNEVPETSEVILWRRQSDLASVGTVGQHKLSIKRPRRLSIKRPIQR